MAKRVSKVNKNIEEVKKTAAVATEKAKEAVEVVTEKVPAAKAAVEKTATKKATTKATSTVKKTAKKAAEKVTPVQETFVEFDGQQVLVEEIVAKVKEAYVAEGHRVTSIKSLRTYINQYERKAYYVINDNAEGKFVEF